MRTSSQPLRALDTFAGDRFHPAVHLRTGDAARVCAAVERARRTATQLRPIGARFSISDVAIGGDAVLEPHASAPRCCTFDAPAGRRLVRIPAGVTLSEVCAHLDRLGLALPTMPNFTGVSFVGACATSSHGASVHQRPLGSIVRAFELVDGLARHRWVVHPQDRDLGLGRFLGATAVTPDAALFSALGVHLGAFGVVLSVVIEPVPAYWIAERRERCTWAEAARWIGSDTMDSWDTYSCFVSPYRVDGRRAASISFQSRHAGPPGIFPHRGDPPVHMLRMYLRMLRAMGEFRLAPHRIPAQLAGALDVFTPARSVEAPWHVLSGTDFMGFPPRGIALELAVPYDRASAAGRRRVLDVVEEIFAQCEMLRARGRYVGGYLSIRFARRWDAPLSLTQGGDACLVEILNVDGTPHQREVLRDLEDALRPLALRRHLGLAHHHLSGEVDRLYPLLPEWRAAREAADPDGVFASPYLVRNELASRAGSGAPTARSDRELASLAAAG